MWAFACPGLVSTVALRDCQHQKPFVSTVAVLAHYESRTATPSTFVPGEVADVMVQRMAAERLSRRLIRLLPPDSVFHAAKDFPQCHTPVLDESLSLPNAELPGLRFVLPTAESWRLARHAAAVASIRDYCWSE